MSEAKAAGFAELLWGGKWKSLDPSYVSVSTGTVNGWIKDAVLWALQSDGARIGYRLRKA